MKKNILLILFVLHIFYIDIVYAADPAATEVINYPIFNNETVANTMEWSYWASYSGQGYVINGQGITSTENTTTGGQSAYYLDVSLTNTHYLYFILPVSHTLIGNVNLSTQIKFEVLEGNIDDFGADIGYKVNYPGYGLTGMTLNPYHLITKDVSNQPVATWQTLGGDITPYIANQRNVVPESYFALSQASDFLPKTDGVALYLFNKACASSAVPICARTLRVKVIIDDTKISGTVAPLTGFDEAAAIHATDYYSRANSIINAVYTDIENSINSLNDFLNTNPPVPAKLINDVGNEIGVINASHTSIKNAAIIRKPLAVPTQANYDAELKNQNAINYLKNPIMFLVQNPSEKLLYYPWNATGSTMLDALSLSNSVTPGTAVKAVASLGEYEPFSIVLQNLFDTSITVNSIDTTALVNQFGNTLPASAINTYVVKSWYAGSATTYKATANITPVLVPELLLKDDGLMQVDHVLKKNFLRIDGGTYQDVSSPTALMPNTAQTADAISLQPFVIPSTESKQTWFTLDTHQNVKPGTYTGNIAVTYQMAGDTVIKQLLIPASLKILPKILDESALTYSIYYRGKINNNGAATMKGDDKTEAQYRAEISNMLSHGIKYPNQYIDLDTTNLTTLYLPIRQELGLPCDKTYFLDGAGAIPYTISTVQKDIDTAANLAYSRAVALLSAVRGVRGCSTSNVYMYGSDEGKGSVLTAQIPSWVKVQEAGVEVFVAGYVGTFDIVGSLLDNIIFSGAANQTEINKWKGIGKDVFSYANPHAGVPNPYVYRKNYGLYLWQNGYTGAMDYAYQAEFPGVFAVGDLSGGLCKTSLVGYCSLWNDFDSSSYFDENYTYSTSNAVIDTVQWEGFREGVDDTRYLATLQNLIAAQPALLESTIAQTYLASLKTNANYDPDTTRATIIMHIENIAKAVNLAPSITFSLSQTDSNHVMISGTANDAENQLALVEYRVDGGSWIIIDNNIVINQTVTVDFGQRVFDIRVTDAWGATTTSTQQLLVAGLDMSVSLLDTPDPAFAGQLLSYVATVTNSGPFTATGCTLTNTLPAGVTPGIVSTSQGSCTGSNLVTCLLGNLAIAGSATVTMNVTPNTTGVLNNSANISCNELDSVTTNNVAYTTTTVDASADLALTLIDSPDPVLLGQTVTYTTTVTNNGPSATSGVTATGTLPTCNIGALAVNVSTSCTASVTASSTTLPTQSMSVNAVDFDPNGANNSANANTIVTPVADLKLTMIDSPDPANTGSPMTYNVTVTNLGPSAATAVLFSQALHTGVTGSGSSSQGSCTGSSAISCNLGTLAYGQSATVMVTATPGAEALFDATTSTTIGISSTAKVSATETDSVSANNAVTSTTNVRLACQGKVVTKRGTGGNDGSSPTRFSGTNGADVIHTLSGNDWVDGKGNGDTICGGAGDDNIRGSDGADALSGGSGTDTCSGNKGTDTNDGTCETWTQ